MSTLTNSIFFISVNQNRLIVNGYIHTFMNVSSTFSVIFEFFNISQNHRFLHKKLCQMKHHLKAKLILAI